MAMAISVAFLKNSLTHISRFYFLVGVHKITGAQLCNRRLFCFRHIRESSTAAQQSTAAAEQHTPQQSRAEQSRTMSLLYSLQLTTKIVTAALLLASQGVKFGLSLRISVSIVIYLISQSSYSQQLTFIMASVKQLQMMKSESAPASTFMTQGSQKAEKFGEVKREIEELQSLLYSNTQTISQSTLLLKKRKEMREVDASLDLMKRDYKKRMDECEQRRLQFEKKQSRMRDQVLKFERFIQENDSKKIRAEAKAKHERLIYMEKSKELQFLNEELLELEQSKGVLYKELESKSRYRTHLEQTVEVEEGYEEVSDLLARYYTLRDSREELLKMNSEEENEADQARVRLDALKTELQNKFLVGNSVIHQYQKKLEDSRDFVKEEEGKTIYQEEKKKSMARESSQVAQSIRNIFIRCQATVKVKSLSFASSSSHMTPQQQADFYLDVIYSRMVDLIEITKEYSADELAQRLVSTNLEDKSTISGGQSTIAPASTALTAAGGTGAEGFAR